MEEEKVTDRIIEKNVTIENLTSWIYKIIIQETNHQWGLRNTLCDKNPASSTRSKETLKDD